MEEGKQCINNTCVNLCGDGKLCIDLQIQVLIGVIVMVCFNSDLFTLDFLD